MIVSAEAFFLVATPVRALPHFDALKLLDVQDRNCKA